MANVTEEYYLKQIARNPNKNHFRVRTFVKNVETLISNYRLTAHKFHGTVVGSQCNTKANKLENDLKEALL